MALQTAFGRKRKKTKSYEKEAELVPNETLGAAGRRDPAELQNNNAMKYASQVLLRLAKQSPKIQPFLKAPNEFGQLKL